MDVTKQWISRKWDRRLKTSLVVFFNAFSKFSVFLPIKRSLAGTYYVLLSIVIILFIFWVSRIWLITTKVSFDSCVIILRDSDGRIGNHMFMYASAFGLARKHGCYMYVDPIVFKNLGSIFSISPMRQLPRNISIDTRNILQIYTGCTRQSLPIEGLLV